MWPGQQQPGGEQNPQQPNPYQQPGYQQPGPPPPPYQQPGHQQQGYPQQGQQPGQQPNPYQQPGYGSEQGYGGQPGTGQNPYAQPGGPGQSGQWGPASMPGGPQAPMDPKQGPGGNKKRNIIVASVAAVAVAAAAVAGVFVFTGDDKKDDEADDKPSASASEGSGGESSPAQETDPGGGGGDSADPGKPVVPGWQTVINPKWYSAFDVPKTKDWEVQRDSVITGFEDDKGKVLVAMSAPAYYKKDWCKSSSRAAVGTKGAKGSKDTKEAAKLAAANFALAGYDQKQKGTLKETPPKPFHNDHGIKGHTAAATITGAPKDDKCSPGAGKVVTASWINSNGDLAIWVFYTDAGVKDEVPDATIKKMLGSLRNYEAPGGGDEPRG